MIRLLGVLVVVVGVNLISGVTRAEQPVKHQRLSIAISGGASKGSYEAGLNWAVLKLVRESEGLTTMGGGQIRPVELASVAGASAGGVNSLLSGLTWCARSPDEGGLESRIDDNLFRDTWLRLDINSLLPPQADSEVYLADDALFSRRDYFASAGELRDKWRMPYFRSGCRVPLGVTVTRVKPLALQVGDIEVHNQRFYIPFELRVQEDGTVAFFFDPADYPTLSDPAMIVMPRPNNAPAFSIPDDSIIEAAVATSAFPTAFGRRRLQYCRLELQSTEILPESTLDQSDKDLICPEGYLLEESLFADGGLFDNLPVGLARTLAELNTRAVESPLPVTYLYFDPDRVRYEIPAPSDNKACDSENPPDACLIMDFSFFSESSLLVGAMGTARKYELYRETTSENWRLNLSQLTYDMAQIVEREHADFDCERELPFYAKPVPCSEAIRRAGHLLEIAYDRVQPEILPPYSPDRLEKAGILSNCEQSTLDTDSEPRTQCRLDVENYRDQLAEALLAIIVRGEIDDERLKVSIRRARQSIHTDRLLRVSSRGSPITGTLLGDFGSFLDYKFRAYDYYVGTYDAVVMFSSHLCGLQYSPKQQVKDFRRCADQLGNQFYDTLGYSDDAPGRYVFARIAEREYGQQGMFEFSYLPSPPVDLDMQIIHDALAAALAAGDESRGKDNLFFAAETTFFNYLKENNFAATKAKNGAEPLLTKIISNPETWSTEMTRRVTARLVYLERQAADIFAAREPDPELREASYTPLLGAAAHTLQSATYEYPGFTFSPSTAPEGWAWRYIIPYEFGYDLVQGDINATWQPTLALTSKDLVIFRASLGFTGGLFKSSEDKLRENYLGLGIGYARRTDSATISSYGFTPTWYHYWDQPQDGDQDTLGGDIFVGFMKDRLRLGVGSRDVNYFEDNWFVNISITDLPGAIYWLTR